MSTRYRFSTIDLKANVCLNVCLHFDQILKGRYRTVEAYIFLQAVKLSYLRWHPKWPPEKTTIYSLFVYSCYKIVTKTPHGSSKQMFCIYFKELMALNYL